MNEEKIKKRLKTLASLILKHNTLYHQKDKPEISDEDFDKLVKENNDLNINRNYYSRTILEMKYDINLDNYVRENLKSISARLSRNSKFVSSALTTPSSLS